MPWRGQQTLIEQKDSGTLEKGDRVSYIQSYVGPYSLAISSCPAKGALGTGDALGFICENAKVTREAAGRGRLVILWVAGGPDADSGSGADALPSDQFSFEPEEINPSVEKHPNLFGASETLSSEESFWLEVAQLAAHGATKEIRAENRGILDNAELSVESTSATQLFALLVKGVTNYYLASFVYSWTTHSYDQPVLSGGSFTETPLGIGAVSIPEGLDSLRLADSMSYTNGIWARTRRWRCAPSGHWEPILYTP